MKAGAHNPEHQCNHGNYLWWSKRDNKPRHVDAHGFATRDICTSPGEEQ